MSNIKRLRKKLNLSEESISERLGITLEKYNELEEDGFAFSDDVNQVLKLMLLFECKFEDIIDLKHAEEFIEEKVPNNKIDYQSDLTNLTDKDGYITLYKYKTFNNYIMNEILEGKVFMGYLKDLNDPFEGITRFSLKDEKYGGYSEIKSLAVASFSRIDSNPMMWALYSDNYKGLCYEIKINVNELRKKEYLLDEVNYEESKDMISIESLEYLRNNKTNKYYKNLLFTKSIDWKSEREFRVIYQPDYIVYEDSFPHLIEYDGKVGKFKNKDCFLKDIKITKIMIGYYMSKSNITKVKSWAKMKKIPIVQAYPNKHKDKIDFNEIL